MTDPDSPAIQFVLVGVDDARDKVRFLEKHPELANEEMARWYLSLAEFRNVAEKEYPDAVRWARCAIAIGMVIGNRTLAAEALCVSGDAFLNLSEGALANATFLQALSTAGFDESIRIRANEGIRAAGSLPAVRPVASEPGVLDQFLRIIDDRDGAVDFIIAYDELKNPSAVARCFTGAESNVKSQDWAKVWQYGRAAYLIATAIDDDSSRIKALCFQGDALEKQRKVEEAKVAYLNAISLEMQSKNALPAEIQNLVARAERSYKRIQ